MLESISPIVFVHKIVGALFLPPLIFILLAATAFFLKTRWPNPAKILTILAWLGIYLCSLPIVSIKLNQFLAIYPPASISQIKTSQAIVVLGGGKRYASEYGMEVPNADTLIRLRYAAWLAKKTSLPLAVSGGAPWGGVPEADIMKQVFVRDYGLSVAWVDNQSLTTEDNARRLVPILKKDRIERITLVSQSWHLRRAVNYFESQGIKVLPAPTSFTTYDIHGVALYLPSGRAMQEIHQALREMIGLMYQSM